MPSPAMWLASGSISIVFRARLQLGGSMREGKIKRLPIKEIQTEEGFEADAWGRKKS